MNFGARYERLEANGEVENAASYAISSFADDVGAINGAIELPFGTGTFRHFDLEYDESAWTIAANYKISDQLAIFARYADGFRMPDVDEYLLISGLSPEAQIDRSLDPDQCSLEKFRASSCVETEPHKTTMAEFGLKYSDGPLSAFVTAYFASADDIFFNVPTVINAEVVNRGASRNTETVDIEAEISVNIVSGWHVGVSATYQSPEFVNTPAGEFIDGNGDVGSVDINGNIPVRVPEHFGQLASRYDFDQLSWGVASIHASYSWSGRRFADDANTAELSYYGMVNVGAAIETEGGLYVRLDGKNLNNSEGLSEGDPRAGETVAGQTSTFNASVVLPQAWALTLGKRF